MPLGKYLEQKVRVRSEADRTLVGERAVKPGSFARGLQKRNQGAYSVWDVLKVYASGRTERVTRTGPLEE